MGKNPGRSSRLNREIPVVIEAHNPSEGPLGGKNREVCRRIYDYLIDVWPKKKLTDLRIMDIMEAGEAPGNVMEEER